MADNGASRLRPDGTRRSRRRRGTPVTHTGTGASVGADTDPRLPPAG